MTFRFKYNSTPFYYFYTLAFLVQTNFLYSQPSFFNADSDSITQRPFQWQLSYLTTFSAENEQAFWLSRNDLGLLSDNQANGLVTIDALKSFKIPSILGQPLYIETAFKLAYNLANPTSSQQIYLPVFYGKLNWSAFQIDAGRFNMLWDPIADHRLISGDLLYGTSSVPIPMIRISTPNVIKPFGKLFPYFGVKGYLLHGWFEDSRTTRSAYLHAKNLTLMLDVDGFRPMFGLSHNVQWAGVSPEFGKLPSSFSDFLTIFRGSSSATSNTPDLEQSNATGNHIGTWNMGFDIENESMLVHARFFHLFEDGSGQRMRNGSDGKITFSVLLKEAMNTKSYPILDEFVYEYYNTTNASGMGLRDSEFPDEPFDEFGYRTGGQDAYFTNYLYPDAWTYLGQPINSPFFMTQEEAQRWAPNGQELPNANGSASGSILAHHISWSGHLKLFGSNIRYRQKTSIVRYYGNSHILPRYLAPYRVNENIVSNSYAFYPEVTQYYVRIDLEKKMQIKEEEVLLTFSLAVDRGDWQKNVGLGLQLQWVF